MVGVAGVREADPGVADLGGQRARRRTAAGAECGNIRVEKNEQWNARGRPSITGVSQANWYMYTGAALCAALRSHCETAGSRNMAALAMAAMATGFWPG